MPLGIPWHKGGGGQVWQEKQAWALNAQDSWPSPRARAPLSGPSHPPHPCPGVAPGVGPQATAHQAFCPGAFPRLPRAPWAWPASLRAPPRLPTITSSPTPSPQGLHILGAQAVAVPEEKGGEGSQEQCKGRGGQRQRPCGHEGQGGHGPEAWGVFQTPARLSPQLSTGSLHGFFPSKLPTLASLSF